MAHRITEETGITFVGTLRKDRELTRYKKDEGNNERGESGHKSRRARSSTVSCC